MLWGRKDIVLVYKLILVMRVWTIPGALPFIELLMVIAIISMLDFSYFCSTATPMDRSILESAANMIAQDIRLTQQLAVSREDTYFFEIHIMDNYYQIRSQSTGIYKKEYLHDSISISANWF